MLEQKLGALKIFRQFLPDCLLDHARAGKADSAWFSDDDVAEHREARRHAAGRWIGQDGNEGQVALFESASAAEIFAICISDSAPSCIRAPPDARK